MRSRVVPATSDTKALSKPKSLLKTDDLPELGGPIKIADFLVPSSFLLKHPLTKTSYSTTRSSKSFTRP